VGVCILVDSVSSAMKVDRDLDDDSERVNYEGGEREYTWSANVELAEHAEDREKVCN